MTVVGTVLDGGAIGVAQKARDQCGRAVMN